MRDVKDHGPYMSCHAVVPDFIDEPSDEAHYFNKDPRADHFAVSVRLKEYNSSAGSHPPIPLCKSSEPFSESQVKTTENDVNVKPILKRKEPQIDPKPKKRVRFDLLYKDDHDGVSEEPQDVLMVPQSAETSVVSNVPTSLTEEDPGIPDYLRNPSKYTRYTLESLEGGDEETNKRAFEDFRNSVKKSEPDGLQPEFPVELPKSVAFTPRRKSVDAVPMDDSPVNPRGQGRASDGSVRIAAVDANESGAWEMDEDDAEPPSVGTTTSTTMGARGGRQYRSKSMSDD